MKIAAINGSPKSNGGLSAKIIGQMEKNLELKIDTYQAIRLVKGETPPRALTEMLGADALLIVFPLYVDSLPAPLIELLTRLAAAARHQAGGPKVYAIVNCGFYEAEQTQSALDMIRHFAARAGLPWGYGLGIGRGPMLESMGENWQNGPTNVVFNALVDMASAVKIRANGDNVLTGAKIPRALYKAGGHMSWRNQAKKNGAAKMLRARPYA